MPTIDKATLDAVRATKREVHGQESHKRQMTRISARNTGTLKAKAATHKYKLAENRSKTHAATTTAKASTEAARQKSAIRTASVADTTAITTAAAATRSANAGVTRRATASDMAGDRSSRATRSAITGAVTSTATPSSSSGLIMTTIFLMAGLIVVYVLVTNPGPTTGWLGTLGNSLHALSSNKSLFTSVPVASTQVGSADIATAGGGNIPTGSTSASSGSADISTAGGGNIPTTVRPATVSGRTAL